MGIHILPRHFYFLCFNHYVKSGDAAAAASQPAIFQERNASLVDREKSLIIGADIMGRDMDQNHGKTAKGHLYIWEIFIRLTRLVCYTLMHPKLLST